MTAPRVKQCVNRFERHVWGHGVYTLNGRARHPQTQGKVERYHRTLNEWLTDHGPFDTVNELNASLRRFRYHYNHERPHQGDHDRGLLRRRRPHPRRRARPHPHLPRHRQSTRPTTPT